MLSCTNCQTLFYKVLKSSKNKPPLGTGVFFLISYSYRPSLGPTRSPIQWVPECTFGSRSVMLTTRLDLVLRLRMSGAVPLLPLYVFMASRGTTSHYLFLLRNWCFVPAYGGGGFETKILEVSIVQETARSIKVTDSWNIERTENFQLMGYYTMYICI